MSLSHPDLNFMGLELLLGELAGQESQRLREWMSLALQNLRPSLSGSWGSKIGGIIQPQILRVRRTHMSSAFSVLPDTPTHRAQALLHSLGSHLHSPIIRESTT